MSLLLQSASEQLRGLESRRDFVGRVDAGVSRSDFGGRRPRRRVSACRWRAALARAAEIDKRRAQKQAVGRLGGLPVAVKDIFCERGERTTCASRMLENFARRMMRR